MREVLGLKKRRPYGSLIGVGFKRASLTGPNATRFVRSFGPQDLMDHELLEEHAKRRGVTSDEQGIQVVGLIGPDDPEHPNDTFIYI